MNDKRQRRSFNDEFKHQIVQLYNAGKPKADICREYDLVSTVVDRWIKRIMPLVLQKSAITEPRRNRN